MPDDRMHALAFETFGDADVLRYRELPDPVPAPGHALVRTRAIGLNFADVLRRRGQYPLAGTAPHVAGYEAAGEVVALGDGEGARPAWAPVVGARVAFADSPFAHAELVSVPLDRLIPLPDDIGFDTAAALLLQGLTAQYLIADSFPVRRGHDVLVHSPAGGVGGLLVQLLRAVGARVLGISSSPGKRDLALAAGCDAVRAYDGDWPAAVRAWSHDGAGVHVAYDAVGSTVGGSLAAIRHGGAVVCYGAAGGRPPLVDPWELMRDSKTLTGGDLWNVLTSREERVRRAGALFARVRAGALRVEVAGRFALADGAAAHRFLESRASAGKVLLVP